MGEYILKIGKIEMKKTPQHGGWRAGVTIYQEAEKDNRDSWHGGEKEFSGADASLPVSLELGGLSAAEKVALFVGLDNDAEDAGSESASDKITVSFKVFPSGSKEKVYDFSDGNWSIRITYTLTK